MKKAYSLLFKQCSKTLKEEIERQADFKTRIKRNGIKLLKIIEALCMSYKTTKYPINQMTQMVRTLYTMRQKKDKLFTDYIQWFKAARDMVETQWEGPIQMSWQYIKTLSMFDTTKTDNNTINGWYEEAWNHILDYIFLEGADKTKYGTVVKTLYTQHSLGNNQYPKTLEKAIEALSDHKFDQKYYDALKKRRDHDRNKNKEEEDIVNMLFTQFEG